MRKKKNREATNEIILSKIKLNEAFYIKDSILLSNFLLNIYITTIQKRKDHCFTNYTIEKLHDKQFN